MAREETRNKMNIGSSSLILIFIVLCLVTFGMLSLSSAKKDLELARRNAGAVKQYYQADSRGETFLAMVGAEVLKASQKNDYAAALLEGRLGEYYDQERDLIKTDIPMEKGQALHIELQIDIREKTGYKIMSWNVYNQEDYEIDNSMPVWTGQ